MSHFVLSHTAESCLLACLEEFEVGPSSEKTGLFFLFITLHTGFSSSWSANQFQSFLSVTHWFFMLGLGSETEFSMMQRRKTT